MAIASQESLYIVLFTIKNPKPDLTAPAPNIFDIRHVVLCKPLHAVVHILESV